MDTRPRKRPRPIISCIRCRNKKLKCDRAAPCQNCIKAGCSTTCTYQRSPETSDSLPRAKRIHLGNSANADDEPSCPSDAGGNAGLGIIEDLQQRVLKLEEARFADNGPMQNYMCSESSQQPNRTQSKDPALPLGTLVVKGSRSRYHGGNSRISLLNQFSEAKEFISQHTKDSSLVELGKEIQWLQRKSNLPLHSPESVGADCNPEILQLRASLPPKAVCDRLVDFYCENFEKTLRVLHIPSFLRQYSQFWSEPEQEMFQTSSFLPQLTAVLTLSFSLEGQNDTADGSYEYLNHTAIGPVRTWLQKLGHKQRSEISTLQVEVLVLLVRQLHLASPEELWRASGSLVRSAMVMGLHLNASQSTSPSAFQDQLRRRLWITIAEMDLQISIVAGMPVMAPQVDFKALSPSNLSDKDFDESTAALPPPKPLHEWTETLASVSLASSLSHRINVMGIASSGRQGGDLSEIVRQGQKLEEYLQHIPSTLKHTTSGEADDPSILLNRTFVDIYMRRPLISLYRPILMEQNHDEEDTIVSEIRDTCLESSLSILSLQDYFDPAVVDPDVFNTTMYWNIFQILCKNDVLLAALSVCAYMKLSTPQQPPHSKAALTRIVDTTLDGLAHRISEPGNNIKDVLLLAVVLQSVRGRGSGEAKERSMYQGAQKALSACRQHLLSRKEASQLAVDSQVEIPDFLAADIGDIQWEPFSFEDVPFEWSL